MCSAPSDWAGSSRAILGRPENCALRIVPGCRGRSASVLRDQEVQWVVVFRRMPPKSRRSNARTGRGRVATGVGTQHFQYGQVLRSTGFWRRLMTWTARRQTLHPWSRSRASMRKSRTMVTTPWSSSRSMRFFFRNPCHCACLLWSFAKSF